MIALHPRRSYYLLAFAVCFLFGHMALAQSPPEMPAQEVKNALALSPEIEGAGLYKKPEDGSLGRNFWKDMTRSQAVALIKALPTASKNPAVQKLLFGALLTQTDTAALGADVPTEPGDDLLTLRLNKLIEAGAYGQASELYALLALDQTPKSIAESGIKTMLFTGQKSLACVELKTAFAESAAHSDFQKAMFDYCTREAKLAPYRYEILDFSKKSLLDRAMIAGEGMIEVAPTINRNFHDVPPADLQILMKAGNLSDDDRFVLNVQALEWGLLSQKDFKKYLLSVIKSDERLDPALAVPENASNRIKLAYLLQIATNKKSDQEKWDVAVQAFPIGQQYGLASLTPFAEVLKEVDPKNLTDRDLNLAVRIIALSGQSIPRQYIELIEKNKNIAGDFKLLSAAYIAKSSGRREKEDIERILAPRANVSAAQNFLVKKVIESLDKDVRDNHNLDVAYEKIETLNFSQAYVMPSEMVWEGIRNAGRDGRTAETVLLSVAALRDTPPEKIYPVLFADILSGLRNVGFTDIADELAITAVLGDEKF